MASSTRSRRAPERRKERKKTKDTKTWLHEFLSVFFFSLALFILLSFFSNETIVGYAANEGHRFKNLMGPVGHLTGTMLAGLLGWCTLVLAVWAAYLSYFFWNFENNEPDLEVKSQVVLASGLTGMLVFSCALAELFIAQGAGGEIGTLVTRPLVKMFSPFGASLLCVAFFILSVALTTQITVAGILGVLLRSILQLGSLFLVTTPALCFRGFRRFGDFLIGIKPRHIEFGKLGIGKNGKSKIADEPEEVLPKPRLRRNSIDAVLKSDPEPVKEAQPEIPARDVVVNRPVPAAGVDNGGQVRRVMKKPKKVKEADAAVIPYERPDLSLLTRGEHTVESEDDEELKQKSVQIEDKLKDFGILGRVTHIHPGPVITLFEFEPAPGIKVGRIAALQDDLAMGLRASSIRIIAPIPKRGTVGIEVPNRHRDLVRLRDVLESEACATAESILSVPIGKDTSGEAVVADISTMPHLLMAGATGTGKSVSINAFIVSFLYRADPSELGLILIDPKILELSAYEGIPHLRVPVVTHPKQARAVLQWAINEMERRYRLLQRFGVRNIDGYNRVVSGDAESEGLIKDSGQEDYTPPGLIKLKEQEVVQNGTIMPDEVVTGPLDPQELLIAEELKPLPKIVIVIDELADLMLTVGRDIEELITRLAQKARASGIHLILATQRPSVDVITGLIKANFPARLSFRVTSKIDSRTILDSGGAEKLLGRGDMLLMLPGADGLRRIHGAFVSDSEVKKVVAAVKKSGTPRYDEHIMHLCEKALTEDDGSGSGGSNDGTIDPSEYDSFYDKAVELVVEKGQASTSMIQRAFRIGYNRAARIIEMMEREGVIGPMDGVKPRQVIVPTHDHEQE